MNKSQNYDNSIIVFRIAVFHDEMSQCGMTLLGSLVDSLKGETVYFINHAQVINHLGKFKTKKIIKTCDVTKLKELGEQLRINIDAVGSPLQEMPIY